MRPPPPLRDGAHRLEVGGGVVLFDAQRAQRAHAGAQKEGAGADAHGDAFALHRNQRFCERIEEVVVFAGAARKGVQRAVDGGEFFARGREHARPQVVAGVGGVGVGRVLAMRDAVCLHIGGDVARGNAQQRPHDAPFGLRGLFRV